jgi:hypothetical protein
VPILMGWRAAEVRRDGVLGSRGRIVRCYGSCRRKPPTRPVSCGVCMVWRIGALRVVAGEFEHHGIAMFMWGPRSHASTSTCAPRLSQRQKLLLRTGSWTLSLLVRTRNWRRGTGLSCKVEICRANCPLVGDEVSCRRGSWRRSSSLLTMDLSLDAVNGVRRLHPKGDYLVA